jgi:hypothetical protein
MSNEEIQVQFQIDAIKAVLLSKGEFFYGHSDEDAANYAEEWYDSGFDADDVDRWCDAGCFSDAVANQFVVAGMGPSRARKACDAYDAAHDGADSMYAACNHDMDVDAIVEFYRAS